METTFDSLHDEVLRELCRKAGVRKLSASKGACNKLHRAWQAAVVRLDTGSTVLDNSDLALISKYTGLKSLSLAQPISPDILSSIISTLAHLTKLQLSGEGSLPSSTVVASDISLKTRLQQLTLKDVKSSLDPQVLASLASLQTLNTLSLTCTNITGSAEDLGAAAGRMSALQGLKVSTTASPEPSALRAFPGSCTQLTGLVLELSGFSENKTPQALSSAVSSLTSLRSLVTTCQLPSDAQEQHEALGNLLQLTKLWFIQINPDKTDLVVLPDLQQLVEFHNRGAVVPAEHVFNHPCLKTLCAYQLVCPGEWNGRVAEDCLIEHLDLHRPLEEDLENIPTMPNLAIVKFGNFMNVNGRYPATSSIIQRHADTLKVVHFGGSGPAFEEAWPPDMPRCKELFFYPASSYTLQALSRCSFPALEQLQVCLNLSRPVRMVVPELDIAWLAQLPNLRILRVYDRATAAFRDSVVGFFQAAGRNCEVVFDRVV